MNYRVPVLIVSIIMLSGVAAGQPQVIDDFEDGDVTADPDWNTSVTGGANLTVTDSGVGVDSSFLKSGTYYVKHESAGGDSVEMSAPINYSVGHADAVSSRFGISSTNDFADAWMRIKAEDGSTITGLHYDLSDDELRTLQGTVLATQLEDVGGTVEGTYRWSIERQTNTSAAFTVTRINDNSVLVNETVEDPVVGSGAWDTVQLESTNGQSLSRTFYWDRVQYIPDEDDSNVTETDAANVTVTNRRPDAFSFYEGGPFPPDDAGYIPFRYTVDVELSPEYDHVEPGVGYYLPDGTLQTCGVGADQLGEGTHQVTCNERLPDQADALGSYQWYVETCAVDSDGTEPTQCYSTDNRSFGVDDPSLDLGPDISLPNGNGTVFSTTTPTITREFAHNPAISGESVQDHSGVVSVLQHKGPGDDVFANIGGSTADLDPYSDSRTWTFSNLQAGTHYVRTDSQFCEDITDGSTCGSVVTSDTYTFEVEVNQSQEDVDLSLTNPVDGEVINYSQEPPTVDFEVFLDSNVGGNLTVFYVFNGTTTEAAGFDGIGATSGTGQSFTFSDIELPSNGTYSWYAQFQSVNDVLYQSPETRTFTMQFDPADDGDDGGGGDGGATSAVDVLLDLFVDATGVPAGDAGALLSVAGSIMITAGAGTIAVEIGLFAGVLSLVGFVFLGWLPVSILLALAVIAAGLIAVRVSGG